MTNICKIDLTVSNTAVGDRESIVQETSAFPAEANEQMVAYYSWKQGTQEEKELGRGGAAEISVRIFQLEESVRPPSGYVSLGVKVGCLGQSHKF